MVVSLLFECLYKCFQSHIPTKTRHRRSLAPWVSNETSNLIKRKQTLQKALHKQANENRQRKLEALNEKIVREYRFCRWKVLRYSEIFQKYQEDYTVPCGNVPGKRNCQQIWKKLSFSTSLHNLSSLHLTTKANQNSNHQ